MSMAASIEARSPFLDHKLVEFAASMPIEMKINGDSSKWILRELAKEVLPAEIFNRPKHSFDVPIGKWLNTTLRDMTRQIIAEGVIPGEHIFQSDYLLTHAWEDLKADKPGTARQFWTLLNLGIWSRQYNVTLA
jgi:asparagine synthase (glutamine-hydrolysing)